MIRFSVELEGVESAVENLEGRIDALENLKEFFDDEGAEIIRRHQVEVMTTQGHGAWPPLAASTIKQAKYRPRRSNNPFDTSPRKMWRDLTSKGAPHHIHEATNKSLVEGMDNPVAHWHIKERRRPGTKWKLPKRLMIYWGDDLIGRFTAGLMAFLKGKERVKGYHRKGVSRYK